MSVLEPQLGSGAVDPAEARCRPPLLDSKYWYVGYTKPRAEGRALENLLRQGFECHLPTIRVQKRSKGELAWRREPLFPRYLFLKPGPDSAPLERVRSTFGMAGLVRFAGMPARVGEALIEELKRLGEGIRDALFHPGDLVRLADGPLSGLTGIFERDDGEARAIVLLEFLSREQRVAVPLADIEAAG
jgi:transcriptional antiterminator RfaH